MALTSDLLRGNTEMIILAKLYDRESYGYEIGKMIQEKSGGRLELKEATLYGAFRRLEEDGCIVSFWGNETTGARRRYYNITPKGRLEFDRSLREWQEAKNLIDALVITEKRGEAT